MSAADQEDGADTVRRQRTVGRDGEVIPVKPKSEDAQRALYAELLGSDCEGVARAALEGDRQALREWCAVVSRALVIAAEAPDARYVFPPWQDPGEVAGALLTMHESMARIAKGEEPNKALGWARAARGRPRKATAHGKRAVYDASLIEEVERLRAGGVKLEDAIATIAKCYQEEESRLSSLYKHKR